MVKIIDLQFQEQSGAIAAFLMESNIGPVLIETGPHSTIQALEHGLKQFGYNLEDIRHVFLTHIHLDHAGAAWVFAKHGATIYVHPSGLPHLHNPEKLFVSAKRIYQDKMDSLWGSLEPIPLNQIRAVGDKEEIIVGEFRFVARHTPGHAIHHIAWEVNDFAFTGDVAGVKIVEHGPVLPPCPPPDINLEDWMQSIAYLRTKGYRAIYLTHFGKVEHVEKHFAELESRLINWAEWVKPYWEQGASVAQVVPLFENYVLHQLEMSNIEGEDKHRYALANPAEMSVAGLFRYWSKQNDLLSKSSVAQQ